MMTSRFALRLPVYQAPDAAPAAGDPPPAPVVTDPPAADPPAVDPALLSDDPPAPDAGDPAPPAEPKPHGNKGKKPWYLDRISEETAARQQAEERARAAEELLQRTQRGAPDPAAAAAPSASADDATIEARANQIAQQRVDGDKIRTVISAGVGKFGDWDQKAEMLGAVGAASPAFVLDVYGVDAANAHQILYNLADDPTRAAQLAKMDPRSRTVELVKMSMALQPSADPKPAAAPAPRVSKAPAPPPPVEPGSSQATDWRSDKVSDSEFSKGWDERQRERMARGRR